MYPVFQIIGIIISSILGLAATVIGSLVLHRLSSIDKRIDAHDDRMDRIEEEQREYMLRKESCQREFVSVEQFLRETGYARKRLDDTVELLQGLSGKFEILNQLPQLAGQIASQTVKEMVSLIKKGSLN